MKPWFDLAVISVAMLYVSRALWRSYKAAKDLHFNYSLGMLGWFATLLMFLAVLLLTLAQLAVAAYVLVRFTGELPKP